MPSSARFVLKDSHPKLLEHAKHPLKGRHFDAELSQQKPGTFKSSELLYGLQMACLSITDDKKDTLKNVGKMNPWQIDSMKMITGSLEMAHAPLSKILKDQYDLEIDHHINVSGLSKAGHALDTQGFIAHNDTTIVLSYRCTTSASDWITNLTTTSSAFEIEEDVAQGHSGWWSCMSGCFGIGQDGNKPRVHTGFYNNFLSTVAVIRQYIDPLLKEDQPPRTLYVVGHSLGAGIAAIAACYFVLEEQGYDWEHSKHKLRIVTAGGPRSCGKNMCNLMDERLKALRPTDKVLFARCVRDKDGVPQVPPKAFGFDHISEKLVYLTKPNPSDGISDILINPNFDNVLSKKKLVNLVKAHPEILGEHASKQDVQKAVAATLSTDDEDNADYLPKKEPPQPTPDVTDAPSDEVDGNTKPAGDEEEEEPDAATKYKMIPQNLRDHMPQFYLQPIYHIHEDDMETHKLYQYESYNTSRDSSVDEPKKKKGSFFRRKK